MSLEDRLKIIKKLDAGGMAEVFIGELVGVEGISKRVAVKRILPNLSKHQKFVDMFLDEARLAMKLSHANVVQTFDLGVIAGTYCIVMEFIEGPTMNELLDEIECMPVERGIRFLLQIADGIAAAHKHDIMHRDLKPENILILKDNVPDVVKILDFGLARMVESDNVEDKITMAGEVFGTPTYMSPEQCLGGELGLTTDIYSFGVLAFEALTGEVPFDADNIVKLMLAHQNQTPPVPSEFYPEAKIPPGLDELILKCLEKQPENRFQNGMELAQSLRHLYDLHVADKVGAPKDLPVERRLPSVELLSVGSGSSLTSHQVYSMVQARLRDKLRQLAEQLRLQGGLGPQFAVGLAQISSQEEELDRIKQVELSLLSQILETEAGLQKRTAQLRIAVQDLSYDRELLVRSLTHNPAVTVQELKSIFPYLDVQSAPPTGAELLEDISFQINALELSVKESQDSFERQSEKMQERIKEQQALCQEREKVLETMVYSMVQDLLSDQYAHLRKSGVLKEEFGSLALFYQEALRIH